MNEPLRGTDASPPSGDLGSRPEGQPGDRGPLGLYLHIPFCEAICNYCNFNRGLLDVGLKRRYLHALHQELEDASTASSQVPADSLFFGGGTPSVLDPDEVCALVAHCRSAVNLAPGAEITLEVNPETVSPERLDGYRKGGVNRLSLGVQSFRDEDLSRLGRLHTAARAVEAFRTELRQCCAAETIDFQTIRTSEHLDAALAHYLNHRIGMRQSIRS